MIATTENLLSLFSKREFVIPLFQRHYAWTKDHCTALWEDFIRMVENPSSSHYLGTMVVELEEKRYRVVDGQQRATTIMLLLRAIQLTSAIDESTKLIHLTQLELEEGVSRLTPQGQHMTGSDYEKFHSVMYSENPQSGSDDNHFTSNLEWFKELISKYEGKKLTADAVSSVLERMHLAFVELDRQSDDQDSPQTIFEKMNAEGKSLEVHDLIRNYIFMLAAETNDDTPGTSVCKTGASAKQQSLYLNEWQNVEREFPDRALRQMSHFFRDYLIIKTGDVKLTSGPQLYAAFKQYLEPKSQADPIFEGKSLRDFNTVEILANDIWRHADAWGKVVFNNPLHGDQKRTKGLQGALVEFSMIANAPYYPLATLLLRDCVHEDYDKLARIFQTLNTFVAISTLTEQLPDFNRKFLAPFLAKGEESVKSLIADEPGFRARLRSLWPENFDTKQEIERALLGRPIMEQGQDHDEKADDVVGTFSQTQDVPDREKSDVEDEVLVASPPDMYNDANRNALLYLLLKINEHLMGGIGDTATAFVEARHSIEHIIPQNRDKTPWNTLPEDFHQTYLHSIGNLTLVGKNFNSTLSDRPIMEKVNYYQQSSYAITREVARHLRQTDGLLGDPGDLSLLPAFVKKRAKQLTCLAKIVLSNCEP